jgi:soluble lytic murein transglycosylase-like protein
LALAIVEQESGFDQNAVGHFSEIGAAQITGRTADQYGLERTRLREDFEYNIRGGVTIMRSLLGQFPEIEAIAAYNGGPSFRDSPPHAQEQIRRYVAGVLARKGKYDHVQCD